MIGNQVVSQEHHSFEKDDDSLFAEDDDLLKDSESEPIPELYLDELEKIDDMFTKIEREI